MVSTDYTVSTAAQLIGRMPPVRLSGSKSRSNATGSKHVKAADQTSRSPAPTKPLPPTPVKTVRLCASHSSEVLPVADRVKIRAEPSDAIVEEDVVTLPATVYSPLTPTSKDKHSVPASTVQETFKDEKVSVLEAPTPKTLSRESSALQGPLSQYFEYITPSASLLGRTGSRKERKQSHTPSSSGGCDIYFSPIDTASDQVFLSSPQSSPPISPAEVANAKTSKNDAVVERLSSLDVDGASTKFADNANASMLLEQHRTTLTLADVDRLNTALASSALVQMRVRKSHLDDLPANMVATKSNGVAETSTATVEIGQSSLPTPPPSEASICEESGGIAFIDTKVQGAPITLTSSDAFLPGTCTHLALPYGLTSTSRLRIQTPSTSNAERSIILQSLFAVLNRKTGAQEMTFLAETDVTPSFARAALTELAHHSNLTLDDLEISTPTIADDESIDWCTVDQDVETPVVASQTPNNRNLLDDTLATFSSTLSAETCTMQTLTLSELARLQTAHRTFLIMQPTRYDANGGLTAVKVPQVSQAMRERFAQMDPASSTSETSSSNGVQGRRFREAVIAVVAPKFVRGEEFESFVEFKNGRVRVRCVPLSAEGKIEKWVCFTCGEFDIPF